ncbi:MAG: prepilin-type N-terminal cleavage/methylation domain-containing protein [Planctomycetes bacterium]|nr:prepilin-type N-terminal cleavage/methylation domain-containing protein [Planctomycetota bacterium]
MRTHRRQPRRRGVSLLELLVVVTLMGIFASVAAARFGPTLFGDFGSRSDARRVSLDLLRAQRAAIMTGDNHFLEFTTQGGKTTGYQIRRVVESGSEPADAFREFTKEVAVTVSHPRAEFNFEGQALAAYQVRLAGKNRSWSVTVVPVNGAVRVVEP